MYIQFTTGDLAELFRVSEQTIYKWKREDGLPVAENRTDRGGALYNGHEVISWYRERLTNKPDNLESLDRERARLTHAQANAREMQNAKEKREVVRIDLIESPIRTIAKQLADECQALPLKIKNRMPMLTSTELDYIRDTIARWQNHVLDLPNRIDIRAD